MKKAIPVISLCLALVLAGCGKDRLAPVKTVITSSEQKDFNDSFASAHLVDGTRASWCGGKEKRGIGESITIYFKKPVIISTIYFINGNINNYKAYNRVKDISVLYDSDGQKVRQTFMLKDIQKKQHFRLKEKLTGDKIIFKINDVYKGTDGKKVCIAEIWFKDFRLKKTTKKIGKLKINYQDLILTLKDGGKITGHGDFFSKNCRQKIFSTGSWGYLQDKQVYIHIDCILFKKQGKCVDLCPGCPAREKKRFLYTFKSLAELKKYTVTDKLKQNR